jgi:SAM-dependent methyltransferase
VGPYSVATYSRFRRPDPRLAAQIHAALGPARSVVNVGAGAGSYEPEDREVIAVEPSEGMIAQRPASAAPAVRASAQSLPLPDGAADAAMAILTIHHWEDLAAGLAELRRVARDRIVILHFDPALGRRFWFVSEYVPEIGEYERDVPTPADVASLLGVPCEIRPVPIPWDCTDGFLGAYWRRPEAYLDPAAREAISVFAPLGDAVARGVERLRADLASGAWARRHGDLLTRSECDLGYRLVVASLP